ncbi:MAG: HAD family hydrolase [Armatimonadota bacterium]
MDGTIRVVVFDIGGVMIRLADGWQGACACAGLPYRPRELTEETRRQWVALEHAVGEGRMDTEDFLQQALQLINGIYTAEELRAVYQAIIREEFPGIYDVVSGLKAAGYATACLSNTSAAHWDDLTNPALYPAIARLDYRFASHLLQMMKPDPRIYHRFQAETGFTSAGILFFDDLDENVRGAQACGWNAIRVSGDHPAIEQIQAGLAQHGVVLPSVTP